jgi:hypothetical protein
VRAAVARVLALVSAAFWALPFFGLVDLATVFANRTPEWHDGYVLEGSWGLLFTVLVAVPFAVLLRRPSDPAPALVLAVTTLALLVGAAWAAALPQVLVGLALAADTALVAWLGRAVRLPATRPVRPLLLVLSVVVAAGAVAYGRDVLTDPFVRDSVTNGVAHHGVHAAFGLALAGLTALGAVTGSRLPAWSVVACLVWLGALSLVYPDIEGSLGTAGGIAAIIVAVVVAAAVTAPALSRRPAAAR